MMTDKNDEYIKANDSFGGTARAAQRNHHHNRSRRHKP